eukprot:1149169-Pelagomonas_calceolata.AAC.3
MTFICGRMDQKRRHGVAACFGCRVCTMPASVAMIIKGAELALALERADGCIDSCTNGCSAHHAHVSDLTQH